MHHQELAPLQPPSLVSAFIYTAAQSTEESSDDDVPVSNESPQHKKAASKKVATTALAHKQDKFEKTCLLYRCKNTRTSIQANISYYK
jgi:hypothetical protein